MKIMVKSEKKKKVLLRNLARMTRYGFKEAKRRTLKTAIRLIKKKKNKPFFRTNKRAKKVVSKGHHSSIEKFDKMDHRQVESLKKELGWDGTKTVVQKRVKKGVRRGSTSHAAKIRGSKTKGQKINSSRSRTPANQPKKKVLAPGMKNLKAYEQYKHDETDQQENIVKRRKSSRVLLNASIDKTEFGNSKIDQIEVSKSTNFIPKLNINARKVEKNDDFDNFEETALLSFNNVKLKKNLSGSKSQAVINLNPEIVLKTENQFKKSTTSKFKSGNKRRRSLSRTKSFVDPSSGYKLEHKSKPNLDNLESKTGDLSYSLFQNSQLATSEFRKHEQQARLGGQNAQNFANIEKGAKSFRSHIPTQSKDNESSFTDEDDIDCISTTIRKYKRLFKSYLTPPSLANVSRTPSTKPSPSDQISQKLGFFKV